MLLCDLFADVFGVSDDDDGSDFDFEGFTVDEIGLNSEVDDDLVDLVGVDDDLVDLVGVDGESVLNESDDDMIVDGGGRGRGDDDDVESDADNEWSKDLHSIQALLLDQPQNWIVMHQWWIFFFCSFLWHWFSTWFRRQICMLHKSGKQIKISLNGSPCQSRKWRFISAFSYFLA